jgi:NhaP-type Na+/H+ or K+/H+ antiporter
MGVVDMDPQSFFVFISLVIAISFFSSLIYRKTHIPDIIWLLIFGAILGPLLGVIDTEIFESFSPIISAISIILITFEAGMDVDLQSMVKLFPKTIALTFLTFTSIIIGTSIIGPILIPELTIVKAAILGTILGGLSTIAVTSIGKQLKIGDSKAWTVLALESTIVDPFRVMFAIALVKVAVSGLIQPMETFKDVLFIILVGSITGLAIGVIWSIILHRIRVSENNYMITLAILLQVYYLSEFLAGSGGGTMACFFFGLVLSNQKLHSRWIGFTPRIDVKKISDVNREISFALKSYYFVYTGLIVSLDVNYIYSGLAFTLMIIGIRFISGSLVGHAFELNEIDLNLIKLMYPLGTSALVFSQLPALYDVDGVVFIDPLFYVNIVFPVVLGTIIYSSLIAPLILKRE